MGLEHIGRNMEGNPPGERPEQGVKNLESERPSFSEVPYLEEREDLLREVEDWKANDSEREVSELPYLEDDTIAEASDEKQDMDNEYYSTYEERLKQTPREDSERGEWTKERGESGFIPKDGEIKDMLAQHDLESISYKDGIPDFSDVAESTVEISDMTENRADNFKQCDEKCKEQWNSEEYNGKTDWTARDVKEWRQENGYSWHERNDMKTCDLVPTEINDYFGHLGGVSECKKRDAENGGSDFDE